MALTLKTEFVLSDKKAVDSLRQLTEEQYYVTHGGRIVRNWEDLPEDAHIHVHFRLRGGKGGFGSLLRSFRIHKSTNNLMCRDLNGRRIADVKEEEKLRKWIAKAEQREKVKAAKKKEKYDKLMLDLRSISSPILTTRERTIESMIAWTVHLKKLEKR